MDVSALGIAKQLSDLVGRNVTAKSVNRPEFTPETRTACYAVEPHHGTAVVQLDFHLLAALAGTMIGLPAPAIDAQVRDRALSADLTDAAHEVLNVLSAVIVAQGRAIFKGVYLKANEYSAHAQSVLRGGYFPLDLQVTLAGAKPGYITIASDV